MKQAMLRRRSLFWLIGVLVVVVIVALGLRVSYGPISFSSIRWKQSADEAGREVRYRMSSDLVRRMREQKWDLDRTLSELGTPDGGNLADPTRSQRQAPCRLIYILERPWSSPMADYYLSVKFDTDGKFMTASVHAG